MNTTVWVHSPMFPELEVWQKSAYLGVDAHGI